VSPSMTPSTNALKRSNDIAGSAVSYRAARNRAPG
jgi:hypothetical protein